MTAWADRADLGARFGYDLIASLETGGAIVADALADAQAEAEGWVAGAAALPFAVVPASLKRIVCLIARYNLWRRELTEDHPAYIAYLGALRELRAIAAGEIRFATDPAPEPAAGATPPTRVSVFTDATLAQMP